MITKVFNIIRDNTDKNIYCDLNAKIFKNIMMKENKFETLNVVNIVQFDLFYYYFEFGGNSLLHSLVNYRDLDQKFSIGFPLYKLIILNRIIHNEYR